MAVNALLYTANFKKSIFFFASRLTHIIDDTFPGLMVRGVAWSLPFSILRLRWGNKAVSMAAAGKNLGSVSVV